MLNFRFQNGRIIFMCLSHKAPSFLFDCVLLSLIINNSNGSKQRKPLFKWACLALALKAKGLVLKEYAHIQCHGMKKGNLRMQRVQDNCLTAMFGIKWLCLASQLNHNDCMGTVFSGQSRNSSYLGHNRVQLQRCRFWPFSTRTSRIQHVLQVGYTNKMEQKKINFISHPSF